MVDVLSSAVRYRGWGGCDPVRHTDVIKTHINVGQSLSGRLVCATLSGWRCARKELILLLGVSGRTGRCSSPGWPRWCTWRRTRGRGNRSWPSVPEATRTSSPAGEDGLWTAAQFTVIKSNQLFAEDGCWCDGDGDGAAVLAMVYSTNLSLNSSQPSFTLRPSVRAIPAADTEGDPQTSPYTVAHSRHLTDEIPQPDARSADQLIHHHLLEHRRHRPPGIQPVQPAVPVVLDQPHGAAHHEHGTFNETTNDQIDQFGRPNGRSLAAPLLGDTVMFTFRKDGPAEVTTTSLTCPPPVSDPPRLHAHLPGLLHTVPHCHQDASAQGVGEHQVPALEQQAPGGQPGQEFFAGLHSPSCHLWKKSCCLSQERKTSLVPPSHDLWKDGADTRPSYGRRCLSRPMREVDRCTSNTSR